MKSTMFKRSVIIFLVIILVLASIDFGSMSNVSASNDFPYLIKVNKKQNCVTVYEKNKKGDYTVPVKSMICSVGYATPLGTFKTPERYRWRLLMGDVWGQYSTRIVGSILFHSVWYYKMDNTTLSATQYNKLGSTASHGCVRLTTADAKWIYDNCPIGTTVIIYEDTDPGPLGKPKALTLPYGTGWDPTDPDPKNPWIGKKASITGVKDRNVKWGEKVSLTTGVTAKSMTGMDITKDMIVTGSVDFNKLGKYKITYSVTDAVGNTATQKAVFTVIENKTLPIISGVKDRLINGETKVNRAFALKGVTAKWNNKKISKSNIQTDITYNKKFNRYTIKYSVTAQNGRSRKAKALIFVDNTPPIFYGIEDKIIEDYAFVDRAFALKGVTAYDDDIKIKSSKIEVTITEQEEGKYKIKYKVKDDIGNKTTKFAYFTTRSYYAEPVIIGAKDKFISSSDIIDEEFVLQGVTAWEDSIDITEYLAVSISSLINGEYTITYSVTDSKGNKASVSVLYTIDDTLGNSTEPTESTESNNIDSENDNTEESL